MRSNTRSSSVFLAAFLLFSGAAVARAADGLVVGGLVLDTAGKPVVGATVAVFDDDGEVVGSDVTDTEGDWSQPVEWEHCHLGAPPRGKGLFSTLAGVITWPVRTVARTVGRPAKAVIKSAAKAAGGAALGAAGAASVAGAGPVAAVAAGKAGETVGRIAAESIAGDPEKELENLKKNKEKIAAQVIVRVYKDGYKDYSGVTGVYYLDRVADEEGEECAVAVVDPVRLALVQSEQSSHAPREFGVFTEVLVQPAIALAGSTVTVRAQILLPDDLGATTVMLGRNLETGETFVLRQEASSQWSGVISIPKNGPHRNHRITVVAYRCPDGSSWRDKHLEERLADRGAWDYGKSFPVDPAVLACRTRGYAVLTVTKPEGH